MLRIQAYNPFWGLTIPAISMLERPPILEDSADPESALAGRCAANVWSASPPTALPSPGLVSLRFEVEQPEVERAHDYWLQRGNFAALGCATSLVNCPEGPAGREFKLRKLGAWGLRSSQPDPGLRVEGERRLLFPARDPRSARTAKTRWRLFWERSDR